jgi:uncharacterized coiled-coil protein SlyX
MNTSTQALVGAILVGGIMCVGTIAYTANETAEAQKSEIVNLSGQVHAFSEKLLADQESNLKDLEDNKALEAKVQTLEVTVAEQQTKIAELESKLSKGKKK